jgi:hypothetical protein
VPARCRREGRQRRAGACLQHHAPALAAGKGCPPALTSRTRPSPWAASHRAAPIFKSITVSAGWSKPAARPPCFRPAGQVRPPPAQSPDRIARAVARRTAAAPGRGPERCIAAGARAEDAAPAAVHVGEGGIHFDQPPGAPRRHCRQLAQRIQRRQPGPRRTCSRQRATGAGGPQHKAPCAGDTRSTLLCGCAAPESSSIELRRGITTSTAL